MKRRSFVCCLVLLLASSGPAGAAFIFEQPANASLAGHNSDAQEVESADDFILAGAAEITGAEWYGFHRGFDPPNGSMLDFSVALFADDAGVPGAELWRQTSAASVTGTGLIVEGAPFEGRMLYAYAVALPSIPVAAGAPMWLSVAEADDATPGVGDGEWFWNYSTASGVKATRNVFTGGPWSPSGGNLAFVLTGDLTPMIPAPGTILLTALGTGLVGWLRHRRMF